MSLRSHCRFCAPGPGRDGNRPGSSDTWGRQSSRSRRHPPHPQSPREVFVFVSAPGSFSFTFLFAGVWESGWKAPGGIPADSLTAFEVRRPAGRELGGRTLPAAVAVAPHPAARTRWRIHSNIWPCGSLEQRSIIFHAGDVTRSTEINVSR
nr:interleukin-15 isoform X2 [Symphalangus syndactylus]XP_055131971.1 interleukin-15 isoform X2 [Symphalangus syndactylus]